VRIGSPSNETRGREEDGMSASWSRENDTVTFALESIDGRTAMIELG
jgi:hypothetical protein